MTDTPLFRRDAYARAATASVRAGGTEDTVLVADSRFYPAGGGQPGDTGHLQWARGSATVVAATKGPDGMVSLTLDGPVPPDGTEVMQVLDWDRRYAHMRMHAALHLLSVVLPLPVTGGAIAAVKGRLDFDMPDAPDDKAALDHALNALVQVGHPVSEDWITEAELDAHPELVKTMSVMPPRGAGRVRLVRIGRFHDRIDLQPCGGTHVACTGEIGALQIGKIEKKGRQNRRVSVHFA